MLKRGRAKQPKELPESGADGWRSATGRWSGSKRSCTTTGFAAGELRKCVWLRLRCHKCGDFDGVITVSEALPAQCHWRRRAVIVVAQSTGETRGLVPNYSSPIRRCWGITPLNRKWRKVKAVGP